MPTAAPKLPRLQGVHSERIHRICREIQHHPERPYSVTEMAEECCCVPDPFIRVFKRMKGMTPYASVSHARLEAAKILLRNSSNSIGEIADAVGFSSIHEFSRFSRRKAGRSASEYRA